jgi:hypothetical protein
MDNFFHDHSDILEFREQNFITVVIFYGSVNKNEKTLSHYSKVLGVPHFFALEKDGTLLHSQHLTELRVNGNYNPSRQDGRLSRQVGAYPFETTRRVITLLKGETLMFPGRTATTSISVYIGMVMTGHPGQVHHARSVASLFSFDVWSSDLAQGA